MSGGFPTRGFGANGALAGVLGASAASFAGLIAEVSLAPAAGADALGGG